MVRATLVLLALVPSAFASSLEGLQSLKKRQTLSGDATQQVQGLLTLAQQVLTDAQSGNLSSSCSAWAGSLAQCESSGGTNQVALASCACQSSVLEQLDGCATSYGSTGTSAASGFESFCSSTLPSIAQTGGTSTVGASSTGSSSGVASAASSASSQVSGLASSASSIISAASSVASSIASSAQSAAPSGGASGTSAASQNGIIGASLGAVGLIAFALV
ncbi:hypothetical protein JCM16303_003453 [Sporobolomyces ruberrimus]